MNEETSSNNELQNEIERIAASGGLGRSSVYLRLIRYLGDASQHNKSPREIDIAIDVFHKEDYEPSSDASVRVYMHNLRRKLDDFYAKDAGRSTRRLLMPKGKYEIVLAPIDKAIQATGTRRPLATWLAIAALAMLVLFAGFLGGYLFTTKPDSQTHPFANIPIWSPILNDEKRIIIVVGDYFMFAEGNVQQPGSRLIRDFRINNRVDFSAWMQANPELKDEYMDIQLAYLPEGIAPALANVLQVIHTAGRRYVVVPQSHFQHRWLRDSHIVYLGHVSGMGMLEEFVFCASRLAVGRSYDELVAPEAGKHYESSAAIVTLDDARYHDYALVSTFPGPEGSQLLIIAGLRDEGLMQAAVILSDPVSAARIGATIDTDQGNVAFEALFRVAGADRTYIGAQKEFEAPIDAARIWGDQQAEIECDARPRPGP